MGVDLLLKVGAEKSKGSPAAGGGGGGLLPRFHRSLRASLLVVVQSCSRHDFASKNCSPSGKLTPRMIGAVNVALPGQEKCQRSVFFKKEKSSCRAKLLPDFSQLFYTQKRKCELDKLASHDRASAAGRP